MTERKRTEWIARTIDEAAGTVTLQTMRQLPTDDKPSTVGDPIVFDTAKASDANRRYAMLHGFSARVGDTLAQSAGTSTADKLDAARAMVAHYESGAESWNLKATRKPIDPEAMLANLLATMDPEKVAAIVAAAQAKLDNAKA